MNPDTVDPSQPVYPRPGFLTRRDWQVDFVCHLEGVDIYYQANCFDYCPYLLVEAFGAAAWVAPSAASMSAYSRSVIDFVVTHYQLVR